MLKLTTQYMASMNDFDIVMSNSTYTVVHFNEKSDNLCLCLRARSYTIYVTEVGYCIFHPAKFEQTMIHQRVLLRRESLIDGTAVTIILRLHVLIIHHIFINFWICKLFIVNMDALKL
jgi:hypothetical protein